MSATKPRLLFCISSGRSGTNYLADLLDTSEEAVAFHEAEPTMTGKFLQMINEAPYADSVKERSVKVEAIRKVLDEMPEGKSVYCEANHMFIKTFFDVVMENFDNVEVIVLRRDLPLVLSSFLKLRYFSEGNDIWQDWFSSPNAVTAAAKSIGSDEALDRCDLSIAYLMDIEARALRFQRDYPETKIHHVRVEELNDYDNVLQLFSDLDITPTYATKETVGRVSNAKPDRKKQFNSPVDFGYCMQRITRYIDKAWSMGIQLPPTVALNQKIGQQLKLVDKRQKIINEQRQTIEEQRKTIEEQRNTIDKRQNVIAEVREHVEEHKSTIDMLRERLKIRNADIEELYARISGLKGELSRMKTISGSTGWLIGRVLRKLHLKKAERNS